MKCLLPLLLVMSLTCLAQNEIITPAGQALRVGPLNVKGNLNIDTGAVTMNGIRFLSAPGALNGAIGHESGGAITTGTNNIFIGYQSGSSTSTGSYNTFIGAKSGLSNTTGYGGLYIGYQAGRNNTIGTYNNFIGYGAGLSNTSGTQNIFFGYGTGSTNTTGSYNLFLGNSAGNENLTGSGNTYTGYGSFNANTASGGQNTSLGANTGFRNISGTGNVFMGYSAGYNELGSNKLYIANTSTSTPLIYGDFSLSKLILNGQVGAGTSNFPTSVTLSAADGGGQGNTSAYKLFVKGGLLTEQLIIASGWADYVFDKEYRLKPLQEVESYIKGNGHLPNVPSAANIERNGIDVGDMTRIQQEKIEELTLYVIQLDKQAAEQNRKIEMLMELLNQKK